MQCKHKKLTTTRCLKNKSLLNTFFDWKYLITWQDIHIEIIYVHINNINILGTIWWKCHRTKNKSESSKGKKLKKSINFHAQRTVLLLSKLPCCHWLWNHKNLCSFHRAGIGLDRVLAGHCAGPHASIMYVHCSLQNHHNHLVCPFAATGFASGALQPANT